MVVIVNPTLAALNNLGGGFPPTGVFKLGDYLNTLNNGSTPLNTTVAADTPFSNVALPTMSIAAIPVGKYAARLKAMVVLPLGATVTLTQQKLLGLVYADVQFAIKAWSQSTPAALYLQTLSTAAAFAFIPDTGNNLLELDFTMDVTVAGTLSILFTGNATPGTLSAGSSLILTRL